MFFDVVQRLCDEKGLSISKLALDLKISKSNVTNWKNGSCPRADKLEKIAAYFDVSTDYLLGNEQKNKPTERISRLNNNEEMLLLAFRKLSSDQQDMILRVAGASPEGIKKANEK